MIQGPVGKFDGHLCSESIMVQKVSYSDEVVNCILFKDGPFTVEEEVSENVIIQHMDIEEPLVTLRALLAQVRL